MKDILMLLHFILLIILVICMIPAMIVGFVSKLCVMGYGKGSEFVDKLFLT